MTLNIPQRLQTQSGVISQDALSLHTHPQMNLLICTGRRKLGKNMRKDSKNIRPRRAFCWIRLNLSLWVHPGINVFVLAARNGSISFVWLVTEVWIQWLSKFPDNVEKGI